MLRFNDCGKWVCYQRLWYRSTSVVGFGISRFTHRLQGAASTWVCCPTRVEIPFIMVRWSQYRVIFVMASTPIPGKAVVLLEVGLILGHSYTDLITQSYWYIFWVILTLLHQYLNTKCLWLSLISMFAYRQSSKIKKILSLRIKARLIRCTNILQQRAGSL